MILDLGLIKIDSSISPNSIDPNVKVDTTITVGPIEFDVYITSQSGCSILSRLSVELPPILFVDEAIIDYTTRRYHTVNLEFNVNTSLPLCGK